MFTQNFPGGTCPQTPLDYDMTYFAPHRLIFWVKPCQVGSISSVIVIEITSKNSYHPGVKTVETKSTSMVESSTSEDNSVSFQMASVKLISVVRLPAYHSAAILEELGEVYFLASERSERAGK